MEILNQINSVAESATQGQRSVSKSEESVSKSEEFARYAVNRHAVPRAENLGDLTRADHKVLSEGCESRNNHR